MAFLILDKETDELIDVLEDLSIEDIEEYEIKNPDRYIISADDLEDETIDENIIDLSDLC